MASQAGNRLSDKILRWQELWLAFFYKSFRPAAPDIRKSPQRGILFLDMSYTLKMFQERHLEQALVSRKLGGYFSHVISVHPLAGLFATGCDRFGVPVVSRLDETHVFIEGKIGVSSRLRWLPPLNLILAQVNLIRLVLRLSREAKVDVVRVGDPYYLGLMGWLLAHWLHIPLVIRVCFNYDQLYETTSKPVFPRLFVFRAIEKMIEKFIFHRCDLIAGANENNMNYGLENGGRREVATIFRYGNLIHEDHWRDPGARQAPDTILAELGLTGDRFLVTVARLEAMKCVDDTIRVIGELVRRGHKIRGLIIGDGACREQLQSMAAALGVGRQVVFAGNRDQKWIAAVLPRAEVIVSPHMGRALAEAALAGVPIVAFDYDWQREVVADGEAGYLVPNKDWLALADKAEMLLKDRVSAGKMGEKARRRIFEMMDPRKMEEHERNEYEKLFARHSPCERP